MENQQKVLESNLKKFLDLKRELSFLQHEAEESDRVVNDFIEVRRDHHHGIYRLFPGRRPELLECQEERGEGRLVRGGGDAGRSQLI